MLALTILSIFILLILLLIFIEYRNEKKYQEKRRAEAQKKKTPRKKLRVKKVEPKREPRPKPEPTPKPIPEPEVIQEPTPTPEPIAEHEAIPEPEPIVEVHKEAKELPEANYPAFTHVRLVEMGLSDEEAKEFVGELIPQLEVEIPLIDTAIQSGDFHKIERLTHGIKGSATNLGTGGVSDLLVDYNTYLKTGTDIDIIKAYFEHLKHYTAELKEQYS